MEYSITEEEVRILYNDLQDCHNKSLSKFDVKLPNLVWGKSFSMDAITLCILYKYFQKPISKSVLSELMGNFLNKKINDVQQARHLGRQKGWYIVTGSRGDIIPDGLDINLKDGDYCLISIDTPYPTKQFEHRLSSTTLDFNSLKLEYNDRCATCGSPEGQINFKNPSRITQLQMGHMNPNEPLLPGNIIPQCDECNQSYRDWFVFDVTGKIIDINKKSSRWNNYK